MVIRNKKIKIPIRKTMIMPLEASHKVAIDNRQTSLAGLSASSYC
jgi:hypothetical protein